MFSPIVAKLHGSHALPEMSYFYDLEKPGTFGFPKRILRDIETELLKPERMGCLPLI
jgi:hypothetical protein